MNSNEFIKKLQDVVDNHNTLYVMGCFGAPLTGANVSRYKTNHSYNTDATRQAMINTCANKNPPYYGFDCVNLIKGVLWGWNGDASKTYGGASYNTNGVPDTNADGMIGLCKGVSTDFSKIKVGSAVWMSGHIGVYIGNGLVIESTPSFKNCVQVTVCSNISSRTDFSGRKWTKHGELPYIDYVSDTITETTAVSSQVEVVASTEVSATGISVGDSVVFSGATHYTNANATDGKACLGGTAKVTSISVGSRNPYHIVGDKSPCTVYGWVAQCDVSKLS